MNIYIDLYYNIILLGISLMKIIFLGNKYNFLKIAKVIDNVSELIINNNN